MGHTLSYVGPRVQATRMVRDYITRYCSPAGALSRTVTADEAKELAAWTTRVRAAWPKIRIGSVDTSGIGAEPSVGNIMTVRAHLDLAGLTPDDVDVQTVTGRVDNNEQLSDLKTAPMTVVASTDGYRYEAHLPLDTAGPIGYTVRVIPKNQLLAAPAELGLVINA